MIYSFLSLWENKITCIRIVIIYLLLMTNVYFTILPLKISP
jgi:hypothetical protein